MTLDAVDATELATMLADMLGLDPRTLSGPTPLDAELQLDSLQRLELTAWLADRGVDVDHLDAGRPRSVQEARVLLQTAGRRRAGPPASQTPVAAGVGTKSARPVTLRNGRFLLRPSAAEYIPFLYGLSVSEEVGFRWRYRGAVPTLENFQAGLHHGVLCQFVVTLIETGQPVGLVVAYNADMSRGIGYLAALFTPEYIQSGLGAGAVELFVRYVFQVWSLRKLYMEMPEYNYELIASGAGKYFDVEGQLRDYSFYDGRFWDEYLLAVSRHHVGAPPAPGFPPPSTGPAGA